MQVGPPVMMLALVPVRVGKRRRFTVVTVPTSTFVLVPVTVVTVPGTVLVVNATVAMPLVLVVLVAEANNPPAFDFV